MVTAAVGLREGLLDTLHHNFRVAARRLALGADMQSLLLTPAREVRVEIPVRMDDGSLRVLPGFRVQHNGVRGPFLGTVRFTPGLQLDTVSALAASATWKAAVANVPFGGAMGGVSCDMDQLTPSERERVAVGYVSSVKPITGSFADVLTAGPGADAQMMRCMREAFNGAEVSAILSGLDVLPTPRAAAEGIASLICEAAHERSREPKGLRVAIYGYGQLGRAIARALDDLGCIIVGVADSKAALVSAEGLDITRLEQHLSQLGRLNGFEEARTLAAEALPATDCDVLVLAAFEFALARVNTARVRASMVVEAADFGITPYADDMLRQRGVHVIPDIVTGCGTMFAAHKEWAYRIEQKAVTDEQTLLAELRELATKVYTTVAERAAIEECTLREAAHVVAIERVARTERLRGI